MKKIVTLVLLIGLVFAGFSPAANAQSETVRLETSQTAITLIKIVNKSTLSQELKSQLIAIIFNRLINEV